MNYGGKRQGAGRKVGSKDVLSRTDVQELKPRLLALMDSILNEAEGKVKPAFKVLVFGKVAPYVLKKQPQDIDVTSGGKPIREVRWSLVGDEGHQRSDENQEGS